MPRPDPARLRPASYPHHDIIQVRFQDLDVLGHINNVAMAALFETGRVRFNQAIALPRERGRRYLIANIEINYLGEGRLEDLAMATGIARIGTRSWTIAAAAFQRDRCIATCDATLVQESDAAGAGLADALRSVLERQLLVQS